jgi:hypothetical protein
MPFPGSQRIKSVLPPLRRTAITEHIRLLLVSFSARSTKKPPNWRGRLASLIIYLGRRLLPDGAYEAIISVETLASRDGLFALRCAQ